MDERFLKDEGIELFTGNELILKGALEAEVGLITGYPGSPVSDIFDTAYANRELLKKHGILAEMANNEALSVARLNGSRMAGIRAMAVMKSVGLHVAADGLALGNLSEPHNDGGSLVVVGDDPWIDSTQVNNDSRFLSQHLYMPVMEPSTFQELKDWVRIAFELSSISNLYITYLVTTNQADGGGTVWVRPNRFASVNTDHPMTLDTDGIVLDNQVLLPPRTHEREATLAPRFEKLLDEVRRRQLNKYYSPTSPSADDRSPIGFITSGLNYCYLEHALSECGLTGRFPVLKLGVTYPLDSQAVLELCAHVDQVIIVEEKRGFLESQVIGILHHARQAGTLARDVKVWGKQFPGEQPGFPETRGLNASIVAQRLIPLFLEDSAGLSDDERARLRREEAILEATAVAQEILPARTPTFCPGCPHRDSSSVFLQIKKDFRDMAYMKRTHKQKPVDLVFHGETGCFTMLMFEPNKPLMHNYSGMGLGGGTGAGLDPFVTNKQVVFLGDSTFFHSGMVAISDSIKSGQDITYIILDNKTTAMTGHQPTAGTDRNLMGERTFAQNIETIVEGMASGGKIPVTRVNPEYRDRYRALIEETVLQPGVKVLIADKECGLTFHRQKNRERQAAQRRQGYVAKDTYINVTPEVCEFCLECTKTTGCPGLTLEQTSYGPKIVTDLSSCVSDGACAKVKACPSFEEVTVHRKAPAKTVSTLPTGPLPEPTIRSVTTPWYACTAGIGGMGAGLISSVIVRAAQRENFRVLFSDKKGLAVRNGSVFGHLVISRMGGTLAPLVPYGKADLILGIDLLETARMLQGNQNLRVGSADRTAAVVNTARHPTVRMLMGEDAASDELAITQLRRRVRQDGYWGADVSAISQFYFGTTLYANAILLGVASQLGELPVSPESVEWAIDQAVPADARGVNRDAFRAGRLLVVEPQRFVIPEKIHTLASLLEEKVLLLGATEGFPVAREYRWRVDEAVMQLRVPESDLKDLALRVYDLTRYENLAFAQRYLDLVLRTAQRDRAEWGYEATRAVIWNAFKVMAIKDEVYVAQLLTRPEKRARDAARYHIDESNGDRIEYKHLTRPEFTLFGRSFRWDMNTRDWQLRVMARMKWLRTLLPAWHRDERDFRDWYLSFVDCFDTEDERAYRLWVRILQCPASVNGYREVRRPKMEAARKSVQEAWNELHTTPRPEPRPHVTRLRLS